MLIQLPADIVAATAVAMSTEKTRYYLRGIHIEPGRVAATDGHILTCAKVPYSGPFMPIILPVSKRAQSAAASAKAATVTYDTESKLLRVHGEYEETVLHMEPVDVIDGRFPDWRRVIGNDRESVERAAFAAAVMEQLVKTAKALGAKAFHVGGNDATDPHAVRYLDRDDVFSIIMPFRFASETGRPSWANDDVKV